jgi:hypothetical protein
MQFSRAPFARIGPDALLGDLRFDHGRERGSFEISLASSSPTMTIPGAPNARPSFAPPSEECPRAAPWMAPRADLLELKTR